MISKKFKRGLKYTELAFLLSSKKWMPKALGQEALQRAYQKKITELRGVPLKISQIFSMGDSEKGEQYKEAIQNLEPYPLSLWSEILKNNLKDDIEMISEDGLPASLGQVHQVIMKDGRKMAMKLKYPDIESNMELDQVLVGFVQSNFQPMKEQNFSMPDYEKVLCEELKEEMDYLRESKKQAKVYNLFQQNEDIIIPSVDENYSNQNFIFMTWEESLDYEQFKAKADRKQLIKATKLLTEFYFKMMFEANLMHADPNPGNFGFRISDDEVKLVVYDYGSVVPFSKSNGMILLKIMQIVDQSQGDLFPWYGSLGFNLETLEPLRSKLMAFSDMIFEPFLSSGRYHLKEWNRKDRAKAILGDQRWNFMLSAPPEMIFFMRSLQALFFYGSNFEVGIYLRPFVDQQWSKFKAELSLLKPVNFEIENENETMAKNLVMHVTENGKTKVQMSMPRASVECLEDIIDDELAKKLEEENIDLDQILNKTRENGYRPGDLFSMQKDNKNVRVYLE